MMEVTVSVEATAGSSFAPDKPTEAHGLAGQDPPSCPGIRREHKNWCGPVLTAQFDQFEIAATGGEKPQQLTIAGIPFRDITLPILATGMVASGGLGSNGKLSRIMSGAPPARMAQTKVHGNSRACIETNYLYRLYDPHGNYLKTGITNDPTGRYRPSTQYVEGQKMQIMINGSPAQMYDLERWIVQRDPGPLNDETFAGKLYNQTLAEVAEEAARGGDSDVVMEDR